MTRRGWWGDWEVRSDRSSSFLWFRLSRGCEKLWLGTSPEWQLPPVWNIQDYPVLKLLCWVPISTQSPIPVLPPQNSIWFENNLAHFPGTSIVLDIGPFIRAWDQDLGKHIDIDILFSPTLMMMFKISIFWCDLLCAGVVSWLRVWCPPGAGRSKFCSYLIKFQRE